MELVARTAERSVDERCPYCHDALTSQASAPAEDLVACPGCATTHHRSCVEELGRCTIRGCERSLRVEPETDAEAGRARRASVTEEVRRRLRDRARRFLSDHATAAPERAPIFALPARAPAGALAADGQAPDAARAQQFVAGNAAPTRGGLDVEGLLHTTLLDLRAAKGQVRADLYRRAAELLRTPEGRALRATAEADAAEYEREAELVRPTQRRRRWRVLWVLNAILFAAIVLTTVWILQLVNGRL